MEEFLTIIVFIGYFLFTYYMKKRKELEEKQKEVQEQEQRQHEYIPGPLPQQAPAPKRQPPPLQERPFEDVFRELFGEPVTLPAPEPEKQRPQPKFEKAADKYVPEKQPTRPPLELERLKQKAAKSRKGDNLIKEQEKQAYNPDQRENEKKSYAFNMRQALVYQAILERPYK